MGTHSFGFFSQYELHSNDAGSGSQAGDKYQNVK